MLTTTFEPMPQWSGMILVEPLLFPRGPRSLDVQALLVNSVKKKKDTWASVAEARKELLTKAQWRAWDPRAFESFLQHGLCPTDDARHPSGSVTLATSKENEAACLNDCNGATRGYRFLRTIVSRVPTHLVYGASPSFISKDVREDILHNASGGVDRLASFSLVQDAGHMLNVTHPKQLATKLLDALTLTVSKPSPLDPFVSIPKSKL
jgi:pimeloyl-ACP methyl ester carboxylesterase